MTISSVGDALLAALLAALMAITGWLLRTVLNDRERILVLETVVKVQDEKVKKLETEAVTVECVREVIESALEKRDKQYEARRAEWDRTRRLEIKEALHEEIELLIPRLLREMNGIRTNTEEKDRRGGRA